MWPFKILANCGHKTRRRGVIKAFGESTRIKIPVKNGKTNFCLQCLEKMTIRCAWCGKPIFIGEPITLYSPIDKKFKIPKYAAIFKQKPLQLVGCLRMGCAETGGDRAGFWYPPGKVIRVQSPIERALSNKGEVVVISDLSSMKEAMQK